VVALLVALLLGLNLPDTAADSYDASKPAGPAGWSARAQKAKVAAAKRAGAGLKWRGESSGREPARGVFHDARPIADRSPAKAKRVETVRAEGVRPTGSPASAGPALAAPQVNRALHEVKAATKGEIELTSLTTPSDDPAADPFQDEVTDEDEMADDGEAEDGEYDEDSAVDEDEQDERGLEDLDFDATEMARRDTLDALAQPAEEPEFDIRGQLPSLGEAYAQGGPNAPEPCPSPRDLKPIKEIDHRIAAEPGLFPQECALSEEPFQPRRFAPVTFTWKASALCHKPLWFEQPGLERYGHTFGPVLTPIVAAGHFFVLVPCIPYNFGMSPPWECEYALGWYRPGDCAPYTLGPVPLSLRGAATQAVVTTGLWFLFP
jgi:hypothetical protein